MDTDLVKSSLKKPTNPELTTFKKFAFLLAKKKGGPSESARNHQVTAEDDYRNRGCQGQLSKSSGLRLPIKWLLRVSRSQGQ